MARILAVMVVLLVACGGDDSGSGGGDAASDMDAAMAWVAEDQQDIDPGAQECLATWMVENLSPDEFDEWVSTSGFDVLSLPRFDEFSTQLGVCFTGA